LVNFNSAAGVESEDWKLHAFDDALQQRKSFRFPVTAHAQVTGEFVDLRRQIAERIALANFGGAKRIMEVRNTTVM